MSWSTGWEGLHPFDSRCWGRRLPSDPWPQEPRQPTPKRGNPGSSAPLWQPTVLWVSMMILLSAFMSKNKKYSAVDVVQSLLSSVQNVPAEWEVQSAPQREDIWGHPCGTQQCHGERLWLCTINSHSPNRFHLLATVRMSNIFFLFWNVHPHLHEILVHVRNALDLMQRNTTAAK